MSLYKKLKTFYKASPENKLQVHAFFAFLIIPFIGMTLLYLYVNVFVMTKLHYNAEGRLTDVVTPKEKTRQEPK
jgi:hypothetical protein